VQSWSGSSCKWRRVECWQLHSCCQTLLLMQLLLRPCRSTTRSYHRLLPCRLMSRLLTMLWSVVISRRLARPITCHDTAVCRPHRGGLVNPQLRRQVQCWYPTNHCGPELFSFRFALVALLPFCLRCDCYNCSVSHSADSSIKWMVGNFTLLKYIFVMLLMNYVNLLCESINLTLFSGIRKKYRIWDHILETS